MQNRLERLRKQGTIFHEPDLLKRKKENVSIDGTFISSMRWAIKLPVPAGDAGKSWGDLYFAQDLASALNELGQDVVIDRRNTIVRESTNSDDVILNIRGLERVKAVPGKVNVLWIISTPELVTKNELAEFDLVFAASKSWAEDATKKFGKTITPLLQCTDPKRFSPEVSEPDTEPGIVFVGNARNKIRKVIADSKRAKIHPRIYGKGWEKFVDSSWIQDGFISNEDLPRIYRSSTIILNDHRPDMEKRGFLSNRLFDAAAAGARIVSDDVAGIDEVFLGAVQTYRTPKELSNICSPDSLKLFGDDEVIRNRAFRIGIENSFDARAKVLLQAVNEYLTI
jgi:hypothetical protein